MSVEREAMTLDAGGCGGCAAEVETLLAAGGAAGAGLRGTALPGRAELLLVTGCVTTAMRDAVVGCRRAMPEEAPVVAVGDCAISGGPFRASYAVAGGLDEVVPVALTVRGCPPSPSEIAVALRLDPEPAAAPITPPAETVASTAVPAADPARLPPVPRRRLGDGDSSAG